MTRLEALRAILPFCQKYKSRGIWILPFELVLSYDPSIKDITEESLPIKSDVQKNIVWNNIVGSHYCLTSLYEYEKVWYDFRVNSLKFIKEISKLFKALIEGRFKTRIIGYEELKYKLENFFKDFPTLSNEFKDNFSEDLWNQITKEKSPFTNEEYPLKKWYFGLKRFFKQITIYIDNKDTKMGRLAVHNLKDSQKYLKGTHKTFESFFNISYDYFSAKSLDKEELEAYDLLADLLNLWIIEPPKIKPKNALSYIKQMKKIQQKRLIYKLNEVFDPLKLTGLDVIIPENIYIAHPLRYLVFAFSVKDPRHMEKELAVISESLIELKEIANFFYLVPLHEGTLFCNEGYKINSYYIDELLSKLKEDNVKDRERITLQPIPINLMEYLPNFEFKTSPVYQTQKRITELLDMVQILKKTKDYIEPLSLDQNKYVLELYKRQKENLHKYEKNLATSVIEIKNYLLTEFFSQSKEPYFKELYDFLSLIEISLENNTLDKCLEKFDNERISNAIDLFE
jgi:hypothetical protein